MRLLYRKYKGSIGDILGTAMCMVLLMTILVVTIQYTQILSLSRSVERIGRTAILLLEEQGELTSSDRTLITNKIREQFPNAVIDIRYNGTNRKVGYGEYVNFDLTVTCDSADLDISGIDGLFGDVQTFHTSQDSIAKH
ncbi:MAG: hypothetical protein K6E95_00675 [Lachnospiraceae bacterium]|nr:hypothetical protein [Lachnospiraceae bacterium]